MKIQYLGTAAAEGIPAFFCACPHCEYARRVGGIELRTRSGALVDDALKIDFSADTLGHMMRYGLNFNYLRHVLITHSHEDHFYLQDILYRRAGFSHPPKDAGELTVYGNQVVCDAVDRAGIPGIVSHRLRPFETENVGGYCVTALRAIHMVGSSEEPLFYLIEKDGKKLLYAHDTDEFPQEDMEFLAGKHIDLISLDCTNGLKQCDYVGHMGLADNLRQREGLLANGAADAHTRFVVNHFSHNGAAPYEQLKAAAQGMAVAYDGLTVEF